MKDGLGRILSSLNGDLWVGKDVVVEIERKEGSGLRRIKIYNESGEVVAQGNGDWSYEIARWIKCRRIGENIIALVVKTYATVDGVMDVFSNLFYSGETKLCQYHRYERDGNEIIVVLIEGGSEHGIAIVTVNGKEVEVENGGDLSGKESGFAWFSGNGIEGTLVTSGLKYGDEWELKPQIWLDNIMISAEEEMVDVDNIQDIKWGKLGYQGLKRIKR